MYPDKRIGAKYYPDENRLFISYDYQNYSILARFHPFYYGAKNFGYTVEDSRGIAVAEYTVSTPMATGDIKNYGVVKYNKVFEGEEYPNVGDFYNIGTMAIRYVLNQEELDKLPPDTNAEVLAFLFGQSAMLMHKYKEEVSRNGEKLHDE